ncbi:Protein trichome birefringence-like [Quillaja saponaria]|uniref:Protein trichome birefringence-like n=1 Tax=Quillaja saponaria TaxID=32244 RepID=A0AAD7LDA4_QUISA|nr:Protein trichome birefringence-like [Quillaja saponaria]
MKGGVLRLKGKEISLISIVVMATIIIIWSWGKTPILTAFIPPQTQLQLSPDILNSPVVSLAPPQSNVHVGKDESSFTEKETISEKDVHLDAVARTDAEENSSEGSKTISNMETNSPAEKDILSSPVVSLAPPQSHVHVGKDESSFTEKETISEKDIHLDVVTRMDAEEKSSERSKTISNTETNPSEEKEILSSISDEEAKNNKNVEAGKKSPTSLTKVKGKGQQLEGEQYSKQEEHRKDLVAPTDSSPRISSISGNYTVNLKNLTENKACNYAKGKWVPDNNRPLYSGFGCKQWLSGMWACRLTQRTDFAYEKLRWQPKECQMEEFEGSKFLGRMQNKILAFVGDSLGRQQFQSLMCMITSGEETNDVEDVGKEYGLAVVRGSARPSGWAYRFSSTNTTVLYYWSAILCDVEPLDRTNPATDYAMHLDQPAAFLRQYLHKFDVLVLNTGHHWNRGKLNANRWVMHVGGKPNTDRKIAMIGGAKNLTVYSIVSWVNSQLPKYPGLKAFFRTISPRHFMGGDWNTGGSCDNTTPMSVGKEILADESSDQLVAGAVQGTRVKLLDITALSQLRDEAHMSRFSITAKPGVQDCLHWCLPGVPDTWNEILFAQI